MEGSLAKDTVLPMISPLFYCSFGVCVLVFILCLSGRLAGKCLIFLVEYRVAKIDGNFGHCICVDYGSCLWLSIYYIMEGQLLSRVYSYLRSLLSRPVCSYGMVYRGVSRGGGLVPPCVILAPLTILRFFILFYLFFLIKKGVVDIESGPPPLHFFPYLVRPLPLPCSHGKISVYSPPVLCTSTYSHPRT